MEVQAAVGNMEIIEFEKNKKSETEEESLGKFCQEIQGLIDEEIKRKGEDANPDLVETKVGELTGEDKGIWEHYKKLTPENITREDIGDFFSYRASIDSKKEVGRFNFAMFLGNKYNVLLALKESEKE